MPNAKAIKEIRTFNRFYTNLIGVVDQHILESSYSLTEVRVMFEIYHDPNCTARKIRNFLQVDEGYLSRIVDKLIKQGLIVRRQSESDGRSFLLSLSRKGERVFLALNERSEEAVEFMIRRLSSPEVKDLLIMLRRIQELLARSE